MAIGKWERRVKFAVFWTLFAETQFLKGIAYNSLCFVIEFR